MVKCGLVILKVNQNLGRRGLGGFGGAGMVNFATDLE